MKERQIDYKLVNLVLFILIIYLIYQTSSFWLGVVSILKSILLPFFIAFIIAYVLNIMVSSLVRRNVPRWFSIIVVLGVCVFVVGLLSYLVAPVFVEQITNLFNGIISFFKEITLKYNIEFSDIQHQLSTTFNDTLEKMGSYVSNGAINLIGIGVNILSGFFIVLAATIYFLIDMDKIEKKVKRFWIKKNKRIYLYLSLVNKELKNYLSGFLKIIIISFIEYIILYSLIGHPNAFMLGTLASFGNFIPYFGGIITNLIAAITAFVISPELFIKTIIIFIVFSSVDGYIINPLVYGKSNQIHPLIIIISVFAGGILGGFIGIIFALPIAIIILSTYNFFKTDINKIGKRKFSSYK
ncbi:MAG: AI-2E family transporter [Bacilli bacterium]|nr:AI-2E family transporter [Bacilli bacterium]